MKIELNIKNLKIMANKCLNPYSNGMKIEQSKILMIWESELLLYLS